MSKLLVGYLAIVLSGLTISYWLGYVDILPRPTIEISLSEADKEAMKTFLSNNGCKEYVIKVNDAGEVEEHLNKCEK